VPPACFARGLSKHKRITVYNVSPSAPCFPFGKKDNISKRSDILSRRLFNQAK
jgi:hypothetical protein